MHYDHLIFARTAEIWVEIAKFATKYLQDLNIGTRLVLVHPRVRQGLPVVGRREPVRHLVIV
jgi:hypothetical protein